MLQKNQIALKLNSSISKLNTNTTKKGGISIKEPIKDDRSSKYIKRIKP